MTQKLQDEIALTRTTISDVAKLLDKKIKCENQKEILHLSYFDILTEHMASILLLIDTGYTGSAFALIRPFFETSYRGLWVFAYANDEIINKIVENKFTFNTSEYLEELDTFYTKEEFFKSQFDGWWGTLCGFTHTDILPLSRRWTGEDLISNYTDEEIIEVLQDIRHMFILFAYTIFKHYKLEDEISVLINHISAKR